MWRRVLERLRQNDVRVFQHMLRSGRRTHRRTSSPLLPSRRAQNSGNFVGPVSTWTVSFPSGMGVLSRLRTRASIIHCSTLCSLVEWYIVAGLAQRLWEPWTGGTLLFWLSWFSAAVVVVLLFSSSRHATGLSSPTSQSLSASSRSFLQLSMSLDTGSSARQHGHRSRSPSRVAASLRFSPGLLKASLVRMRPRGHTPHGYSGFDGGSCVTGASDGSVRTRLHSIVSLFPDRCVFQ